MINRNSTTVRLLLSLALIAAPRLGLAQPHQLPVENEYAFVRSLDVVSPPYIVGASNCADLKVWNVSIRGGDPKAGEYDLYFGGSGVGRPHKLVASVPVGSTSPTVVTVDLSSVGFIYQQVGVYTFFAKERRQIPLTFAPFGTVTVTSRESNYLPLRDPNYLTAPYIAPSPLYVCGAATAIGGHQPSDRLRLMNSNGSTRFTVPSAWGAYDFVGEVRPSFSAGEKLYAEYDTCAGNTTSPPSVQQTVVPYPRGPTGSTKLPKPAMTRSTTVAGVSVVPVLGVVNGATLLARMIHQGAADVVLV